ncbi:hypothetical protein [Flavonifractor plautii]|uniref:Uncharacterized protein n=1 Tax=Candidatus Flavonifractor intestinigallinarum TaxID=2838586 RepID=A0A9D2MP84_9FIRM|nr:hypothetical protein [Flavonifractor plautii]MBM6663530.1 hypothetical protein [Flavonifractor plautii]HJB81164.1 hypothetical protein [Candidatus Flavonifractor intestinigallinarum]
MAFQYVDYPQEMKDLLSRIFSDAFMQTHTRFQSFEGFRYSSAVFVNWNSDQLIYNEALLDRFVQESTQFSSWEEMVRTAADQCFQPAVCS